MTITIVGGGNPSGPTFPVQRSVRLRSSASAYLNRTFTTPTNQAKWTWSGWVKRGLLGTQLRLLSSGTTASDTTTTTVYFTSSDTLAFSGGTTNFRISNQVFRDPSAWYHIVIAVDTTLTEASKILIYVNGVQITFATTNAITTCAFNSAQTAYIGQFSSAGYFDGYLTEVNFIDGQALTPSSFGAYNNYGVWSPAKYTGTYGNNGFYLPFTTNTNSETLGLDYANTNPELITNGMFTANVIGWTVTPGTGGSPSITWQSAHTARLANINAFGATYYQAIPTVIGQTYYAQCYTSNISLGGSTRVAQMIKGDNVNFSTNLVVIGSVQQSAGAGGIRNTFVATATTTYIGIQADIGGVSGSADFTQISVALGAYKNSWNPFNISTTAGVTYDSMLDVPTLTSATNANFCVANPLDAATSLTINDGNLKLAASAGGSKFVRSSFALPASGAYYAEITFANASTASIGETIGICTASRSLTAVNNAAGAYLFYASTLGALISNGTTLASSLTAIAANELFQVAIDVTNSKMWIGRNNVWYNSTGGTTGDPSTGANPTFTGAFVDYYIYAGFDTASAVTANLNFGQRPFAGTVPTGFKSLNTYNLPAPTIPNGAAYMAATTYTGVDSVPGSVVNSGAMRPDLVWIKSRALARDHRLTDSVRGTGFNLTTDSTAAEAASSIYLTSFNSNGFSYGAASDVSNGSMVAWQWKAGGTPAVINTSGSTPSTISANTTAGFSIVTYTGTGANATVGHGLGVAPKMVIVKNRGGGGVDGWVTYHASVGNTGGLILNTTAATQTTALFWNNTSPTSSVFTVSTSTGVNASTNPYVAYCFSEIAGYSKFGSYTGNGSTDGTFVYLGFRPRFVLVKSSSAVEGWVIWDSSRNTYNTMPNVLYPNLPNAEGGSTNIDFLSNGFKLRNSATNGNITGVTYIYAAFAENPFNYSLAR